jgi:transcriptional regulator with XRE-family HTH domain
MTPFASSRPEPVGSLLRSLRQRRGLSQLALSQGAGISQRHISFVESGRSMPSRELIVALSRHLEVTPRERNTLLLAAGFAPIHRETPLTAPALAAARAAVELVLRAHEPFPALAVDRHWSLVLANRAVTALTSRAQRELLQPPINVLRLSLHPQGLAPHILNLAQWRDHVLVRLDSQVRHTADPVLRDLLEELRSYPTGASASVPIEADPRPSAEAALAAIAVPFCLASERGPLTFLSTTTVFGSPVDITLSELAIEAFLPANPQTAEAMRTLLTPTR